MTRTLSLRGRDSTQSPTTLGRRLETETAARPECAAAYAARRRSRRGRVRRRSAAAASTADRLGFGGSARRTRRRPPLRAAGAASPWRASSRAGGPASPGSRRGGRAAAGPPRRGRPDGAAPVTPARVSKSSGSTVIRSRAPDLRPAASGVVPATYPATSCSTTAAYRQPSSSGQLEAGLLGLARPARAYRRRTEAGRRCRSGSSSRGFWNTEASSTQRATAAAELGRSGHRKSPGGLVGPTRPRMGRQPDYRFPERSGCSLRIP